MAQKGKGEKKKGENWKLLRKIVLPIFVQAVAAAATIAVIFYGGYYHCPSLPVPSENDFTSKLVYTFRCVFAPGVVLCVAIAMVGLKRGSSAAINPLAGKDDLIQLDKNFLSNTLEQFVVFLALTFALVTFLNGEEMKLVPLYATAFIVGRILFRVGYGISPWYRSWGMYTNFSASGIVIGLIIYFLFTRGFMFGIGTAPAGGGDASTAGGRMEL